MKKKLSLVFVLLTFMISAFALSACTPEQQPPHEHEYKNIVLSNDVNIVTPATCSASAIYKKSCECGEIINETFSYGAPDATAHIYANEILADETNLVSVATCSTFAVYKKVCSACGVMSATQTFEGNVYDEENHIGFTEEIISNFYRVPGEDNVANHYHGVKYYKSCMCGDFTNETFEDETTIIAHTFDQEVAIDHYLVEGSVADHFHGKEYYKSCSCGLIGEETFEDATSIVAHTFDQLIIDDEFATGAEATCEHGTEYYKSCACGTMGEDEVFYDNDALPHDWVEEVREGVDAQVFRAETATEPGVYKKICKNCDACHATATFVDVTIVDADEFNVSLRDYTDKVAIPYDVDGNVVKAMIGSKEVDFTSESNTVKIDKTEFGFGASTLVINIKNEDGFTQTVIPLDIATFIMEDKADLLSFASFSRTTAWGSGELYIVDADIDMEGANYGINIHTNGSTNIANDPNGFAGVFDGRGHVISNINITGNGFISGIRIDGELKNLSFVNATQTASGFIGNANADSTRIFYAGAITNVYAQVIAKDGAVGFFGGTNYAKARNNNVVIDVINAKTSGTYWLQSGSYNYNFGSYTNVYAIGATRTTNGVSPYTGSAGSIIDRVQVFDNFTAFKAGGNDLAGNAISYDDMDRDFWNIVNGVPVSKGLDANKTPLIVNAQNKVFPGSTLLIETNGIPYAKYELATAVNGVSINANVVTIDGGAQGKFTVKVTNQVTGVGAEKEFEIQETTNIALASKDIDLGTATDKVEIDVRETFTANAIEDNDVASVTFAGKDLEYSVSNGKILFNKSDLNVEANLGGNTVVISAISDSGIYAITQPVVVCSKIIMNKTDATNMSNYLIAKGSNGTVGYFILGANIDMEGTPFGVARMYDGTTNRTLQSSTFDGRNFTVSNVTNTAQNFALFSFANNCTIKNLKMTNFVAQTNMTSPLIEAAYGNTVISNVFVEGSFNATPTDGAESSLAVGKVGDGAVTLTMTNVYTVLKATSFTDYTHLGTHFGEGKASLGTSKTITATLNNCVALSLIDASTITSTRKLDLIDSTITGTTRNNAVLITSTTERDALTGHSGSAWDAFKAYTPAQA